MIEKLNEVMTHIHSYPSIYAIGHRAIPNLFTGDVLVEEKIDGSQFSMSSVNGQLCCRSKGKDIVVDAPEKMFQKAVDTAKALHAARHLIDGWVYRCEYLQSPKHNTLAYNRTPNHHLILFDVERPGQDFIDYESKEGIAHFIGLEVVPRILHGSVSSAADLLSLLDRESILGGCKIEGVVVKNYHQMTNEKKVSIGKYVSESFKEKHRVEWKASNPTQSDIVTALIAAYRTDARWMKAIQHLRDDGKLKGDPSDIGMLMKEIPSDVLAECGDEIKERLFKHFWQHIHRGIVKGFPEFYKQHLAKQAFNESDCP